LFLILFPFPFLHLLDRLPVAPSLVRLPVAPLVRLPVAPSLDKISLPFSSDNIRSYQYHDSQLGIIWWNFRIIRFCIHFLLIFSRIFVIIFFITSHQKSYPSDVLPNVLFALSANANCVTDSANIVIGARKNNTVFTGTIAILINIEITLK